MFEAPPKPAVLTLRAVSLRSATRAAVYRPVVGAGERSMLVHIPGRRCAPPPAARSRGVLATRCRSFEVDKEVGLTFTPSQ
jgi:hypothetical protein